MTDKPTSIDDIRGWFWPEDRVLFAHFLGEGAVVDQGDLVELGTFLGKSAVLMGAFLHPGETFTALDLFHSDTDDANQIENKAYPALSRERFESNYLAFHDELPVIVEGPSSTIVDHVAPSSARFIHVDASHLYAHVATDVQSARSLIKEGGVVVFDDYRAEHTPGVSAAVWEATVSYGFRPFLITPQKMYGVFDIDPTPHRDRVLKLISADSRWDYVIEGLLGATIVRAKWKVAPDPLPKIDQRLKRIEAELDRQGKLRTTQFRKLSRQLDEVAQSSVVSRVRRRLGR